MRKLGWIVLSALALGCGATGGATPARLVGTKNVEPLAQLEVPLVIYVDDSISGAVFTVPLATATSAPGVVEGINAVTTGRIVASVSEGRLALTTVEEGKDVFLSVYNGASAEALGLSNLPLARGTTTR